ncbi:hypothetical protein JB92DRAFT_2885361 [Gautieria morchelliformis]|nr:hypothetical protein JB92DRAFT_2885361 [Gautieria morchelliformis]
MLVRLTVVALVSTRLSPANAPCSSGSVKPASERRHSSGCRCQYWRCHGNVFRVLRPTKYALLLASNAVHGSCDQRQFLANAMVDQIFVQCQLLQCIAGYYLSNSNPVLVASLDPC